MPPLFLQNRPIKHSDFVNTSGVLGRALFFCLRISLRRHPRRSGHVSERRERPAPWQSSASRHALSRPHRAACAAPAASLSNPAPPGCSPPARRGGRATPPPPAQRGMLQLVTALPATGFFRTANRRSAGASTQRPFRGPSGPPPAPPPNAGPAAAARRPGRFC